MTRATIYPQADAKSQWFAARWPGDVMPRPNCGVLHTTEGSNWPDYAGGSMAPTFTVFPGRGVRQHFPVNMSARALQHPSGTVPTNTLNVVQVECVGTCAKGGPGLFWPGAADADMAELAQLVAWLAREWPIPLTTGVEFVPYPASYGTRAAQRMTAAAWLGYSGWAGHQHVPNNDHGDPGAFPTGRLLELSAAINRPPKPKPPKPPVPPTPENDVALTDADAKLLWDADFSESIDPKRLGWKSTRHSARDVLYAALVYAHDTREQVMVLQAEIAELKAALQPAPAPDQPTTGA